MARGYRAPLNITRGKDVFQKIAKAGLPLVDVISGTFRHHRGAGPAVVTDTPQPRRFLFVMQYPAICGTSIRPYAASPRADITWT